MGNQSYFNERSEKTTNRIREIISEMPDFVYDFFVGVENNTSPLTRLNYAYDLRIFFDFLLNETTLNLTLLTSTKKATRLMTVSDIAGMPAGLMIPAATASMLQKQMVVKAISVLSAVRLQALNLNFAINAERSYRNTYD